MRHETALQYPPTGAWHYVTAGRNGGCPIGYCTKDCDHATPAEAYAHYRQFILDNLREVTFSENTLHRCKVAGCESYTHKGLREPDGYAFALLCDEHRSRETYATHIYPADHQRDAWVS